MTPKCSFTRAAVTSRTMRAYVSSSSANSATFATSPLSPARYPQSSRRASRATSVDLLEHHAYLRVDHGLVDERGPDRQELRRAGARAASGSGHARGWTRERERYELATDETRR